MEDLSEGGNRPHLSERLRALLDRDAASRAWLYDSFAGPLFRRLRRRYGAHPAVDVEEVLHDLFVQLYERDDGLLRRFLDQTPAHEQTPERLETALWDAACGIASNQRRRFKTRRLEALEAPDELRDDLDAEQVLSDRDLLAKLDACAREHGDTLYLYLKLRFADGHAPREIATLTGWPIEQVYRLRDELRPVIEGCVRRVLSD
ncbi:MAG: hypothetical protein AAF533_19065 [Acidobacteriota bacterium]